VIACWIYDARHQRTAAMVPFLIGSNDVTKLVDGFAGAVLGCICREATEVGIAMVGGMLPNVGPDSCVAIKQLLDIAGRVRISERSRRDRVRYGLATASKTMDMELLI